MQRCKTLTALFAEAVANWPDRVALEDGPDSSISYRDLDRLAARTQSQLQALGVRPGDRVGIYLRKSIDAIAAILGAMRTGAAYVPVDPYAPAWRAAYILSNCDVRAVVLEQSLVDELAPELAAAGSDPARLVLSGIGGGNGLAAALGDDAAASAGAFAVAEDDLAYILYTSGSTGKPKGVMLSHRNAVSFVDWCSEVFQPVPEDRFSSHAPLHFDLSILDLYVPLKHGARVVLIGAEQGKDPVGLAALIAERGITVWYSTPSVLSLLAQYGRLQRYDYSALRCVLFAGEVFPVKHLRAVQDFWPQPQYFNLYGPTETNVCTFFEVTERVPESRSDPYPIGRRCSHAETRVVDEDGKDVTRGAEGELVVHGPGVMMGYWNLHENTARAFLVDDEGRKWYRTGDIVMEAEDDNLIFVGRRDRMVKRRGYRIELGDIESALYRHPDVKEAAVVAARDQDHNVVITAYLSCHHGRTPGLIELKAFSAEVLPLYMVPDRFVVRDVLPKTSTDKIDYQQLLAS